MKKLFFSIPFKSKNVSNSWKDDCQGLKNLLDSIFNQTNKKIEPHVYIAGNDKPSFLVDYEHSDKVFFIPTLELAIPETISDKNHDKQAKKKICFEHIIKKMKLGDYVSILDADDLLHCDLFTVADRALKDKYKTDLIFYTGYMYNSTTHDLAYIDGVNSIFYKICGSCIISKVTEKDIATDGSFFYKLTDHTKFFEICEKVGRQPYKFTFPAVLYMHSGFLNLSGNNPYIKRLFEIYKVDESLAYYQLISFFNYKKVVNIQSKTINKMVRICAKMV